MKKIVFKFIFAFIMLFSFNNIFALTSSEIASRNVCEKFELALANSDGSIKSISCYSSYNDAKKNLSS